MIYPKTENVFTRDPRTHKLNVGELRLPEFGLISHWLVTEKIDGTNIRLILDWSHAGEEIILRSDTASIIVPSFRATGRSDAAPVPGAATAKRGADGLAAWIADNISAVTMLDALCALLRTNKSDLLRTFVETPEQRTSMIVFGEGYGPGIRKGGIYSTEQRLRIFDVVTIRGESRYWRPWDDVRTVATHLGLETVPVIGTASTEGTVRSVHLGFYSVVAEADGGGTEQMPEGIVARTDPYLFTSRGDRVMWKLKRKDLP